jgi:cytochrome P450
MLRNSIKAFPSSRRALTLSNNGWIKTSASRVGGFGISTNDNTRISNNKNSRVSSQSFSTKASKCPITGGLGRDLSSDASVMLDSNESVDDSAIEVPPTLQTVPSWPIVGIFFQIIPGIGKIAQDYYKVPEMNANNAFEFYSSMYKKYGSFYCAEIPGLGKLHTLTDPNEMLKVLRQEGAYPRGGISNLTPFIKWAQDRKLKLVRGDDNGFFGQGETWRNVRTFMQTDLLSPQAARGYVPGVVEAAQIASKGAKHYSGDLNTYLNYCAFDMFQTIMFGELTKVSDPNTPKDPVNVEFVENSVLSLALLITQIFDKTEVIKGKMGIVTPKYKQFEAAMDVVNRISNEKILAFKEKWESGELTEAEKASYVAHAFERQKSDGAVSAEEMSEIVMFALNAGVDTTSTFISWAMVHLSLNPDIQQKAYEELKHNFDENGGQLSSEMLTKNKAPYLHAILRESHRCTPVHPTVMMKSNSSKDIEINGTSFPQNTLFSFDSFSLGVDPHIVDNPDEFNPDRWTPEATEKRKGTKAAVLDHQFYKDPFSQGARRCPGSRVAVSMIACK